MGKLKSIHIICKRDTESVKVAPESVLSNRGIMKVHTWPGFRRGGVSPEGVISVHRILLVSDYYRSGSNMAVTASSAAPRKVINQSINEVE